MESPDQTAVPPDARGVAAGIIARWLQTGAFPDRLLDVVAVDRAFVMEVVYGVAKWQRQLEWIGGRFAPREPEPDVKAYLLVGLYQLWHMSHVAEYAAVHATVQAAKSAGTRAASFVNAVLRAVLRRRAEVERALQAQALGVRESHPDLLIGRWVAQFGADATRALCQWNNGRAEMVIRIDRRRTSAADYAGLLSAAGVQAAPHPFRPDVCFTLAHGVRAADLPGYADGLFAVQDPSTLVAVELLAPQPGETVVDGCAAPGGKTLLIAERMEQSGRLVALDVHADRLAVLEANLRRMRVDAFVSVRAADLARWAQAPQAERSALEGACDAVLVDVPCTNTGVLRRRPDARWRFTAQRLARMQRLQTAILNGAARLVKAGGRLVYSTCSLEPEEGAALAAAWLRTNGVFERIAEVRTFPPRDRVDGMAATLFRRKAE